MSISPSVPDPEPRGNETNYYEAAPTPRWIIVVFVVAFLAIGYLLYAGNTEKGKLETDLAQASAKEQILSAQIDQTNSRIADLKASSKSPPRSSASRRRNSPRPALWRKTYGKARKIPTTSWRLRLAR